VTGPVGIGGAPPESELGRPPVGAEEALAGAYLLPEDERGEVLAEVVRRYPQWPTAWAALATSASGDVEAYAYYRVGYHRGLDALRKAGWRGSGYVRWSRPANRGFLRCVEGLRRTAHAIGELDEEERCALFLRQLDPTWSGAEVTGDDR